MDSPAESLAIESQNIWFRLFLPFIAVACFAIAPFVSFANDNRGEVVNFSQLWVLAAATLMVAWASLLLLTIKRPNKRWRVSLGIVIVLISIFNYTSFRSLGSHLGIDNHFWLRLIVWIVVTGLVAYFGSRLADSQSTCWFILFAGAVLLIVPTVEYATGEKTTYKIARASSAATAKASTKDLPNIYFFIPDGYARQDQLAKLGPMNNEPFISFLESKGFNVADKSQSNYPVTYFSIPSTLNGTYVVDENTKVTKKVRAEFLPMLGGNNATVKELRSIGYKYISAPSGGWEDIECTGAEDLCIKPLKIPGSVGSLSETQSTFLSKTPVGDAITELFSQKLSSPYSEPYRTAKTISEKKVKGPFFLFSHILQPHPPYQFDENCKLFDRIDPSIANWSRGMRKKGYLNSLKCMNKRFERAIKFIEKNDPKAIILIQSDHGSEFTVDWRAKVNDWLPSRIEERFSNLSALKLPASCDHGPTDRSAINSLKYVIACVEHKTAEPVDAHQYLFTSRYTRVRKLD